MAGVHIEGLRDTTRRLEKLGVDVEELKEGMARVADVAADTMRGEAPVGSAARGSRRPGALRDSVRGNRAKGKAVVTIGTKARVPYARVINYGFPRRNIRPARYIERTDDLMGTRAVQILSDHWNDLAERHGFTP